MPTSISLGLSIGSLTAFVFMVANLYILLNTFHKVFFSQEKWSFLSKMQSRWHYIHYFGNLTAIILMIIHFITLGEYASFVHWILAAVLVLMGISGLIMRFSKISPKNKSALRKYHAKIYMLLLVIILILLSHVLSLKNFPYEIG
jgi:cytochrome b561